MKEDFYFSQNWWQFLVMAIVCYFIGCFNFARVISRKRHKDITKIGSGNPGTMNMSREFGWKVGLLTFSCDALKGGIPAIISYFIYRNYQFAGTDFVVSDLTRYFCGLFVIIGHIFPVTMRFKGGKGIASSAGLMIAFHPYFIPMMLTLFFGTFFLTHFVSLGSLLIYAGFVIEMIICGQTGVFGEVSQTVLNEMYAISFLMAAMAYWRHRENIKRLLHGNERKTYLTKKNEL
jgi:glycerol-3-phosphate acyltransferase PlsY